MEALPAVFYLVTGVLALLFFVAGLMLPMFVWSMHNKIAAIYKELELSNRIQARVHNVEIK